MTTIVDDVQDIHDGFNAISGALADHNEQMIDTEIRIEAIDRIQEQLQTNGPSRPLMEELQSIARNEDLLLEKGVAVESFTSFPSRTNQTISIEVSEELKMGLIGAAVAAGLFIIYKIGKMIWNFFKKKKSNSDSIKENTERVKKAEAILDLIEEAQKTADTETKALIEQQRKEMQDVLAKRRELLAGKWTGLLETVLGDKNSDVSRKFITFLSNFDYIEERALEMNNIYMKAPFQTAHLSGADLLRFAEEEVAPFVKKYQEEIDEEVRDAKEFAERVRALSATDSKETEQSLAQATAIVNESVAVWNNLEHAAAFQDSIFGDEKFLTKLKETQEKIKASLEKELSGISKENVEYIREKFKDLSRLFTKTTQVELAVSGSLAIVGAQYDAYCRHVEKTFREEMGFFSKIWTKIKGNTAIDKAKKLYDEYKLHEPEPKKD